MANPQAENGHIDIANEIAEAFARYFPGSSEGQVIWAILRKTYGWHKKKDNISISQIVEMTGVSKRMVIYSLQNLEAKRIITIERKRGRGNKNEINYIGLQKNYELWVVQEKGKQYSKVLKTRKEHYRKYGKRVVQEMGGSARNGKRVVQEMEKGSEFLAHTKETITKETIQKKESVLPLVEEIVIYLNEKAEKNFQPRTPLTKKLIKARLKEGHLLDAFKWVIDVKCAEWRGKFTKDGKDMEDWLRPQTLFGNKFEGYLNQSKGRSNDDQ